MNVFPKSLEVFHEFYAGLQGFGWRELTMSPGVGQGRV
jgi:hypothetical protein